MVKIDTQKTRMEEKSYLAAHLCRCDKEQAIDIIENHGFELYPMPVNDISLVKKSWNLRNSILQYCLNISGKLMRIDYYPQGKKR